MHSIKKKYTQKLIAYSALSSFFISHNYKAEAQVVFVDIDPDSNLYALELSSATYFDLDFTGDGDHLFDFYKYYFNQYTYLSSALYATIKSKSFVLYAFGNASVATIGTDSNSPIILDGGLEVGPELNWLNGYAGGGYHFLFNFFNHLEKQFISGDTAIYDFGEWTKEIIDKYVGLRFGTDGNYNYGWVRLDIHWYTKIPTLKAYAYESQINTSINTDPTLSLSENAHNESAFKIYSNQKKVFVEKNNWIQDYQIEILDLHGKIIYEMHTSEINYQIDLQEILEGIYIAKVYTNDLVTTKKIIL